MDAFDGGRGSGAFPLWPALLLRFKDGGERSVCPGALPGPCFRSGAVRQEIVHSFLNGSPGGGFPVTVVLIAHAFCKMHQVSPCLKSVNAVLPGFRPFEFFRLGAVGSDMAVHVGEGFRQPLHGCGPGRMPNGRIAPHKTDNGCCCACAHACPACW